MKDVSSFGMQSAALSLPDVILSDWGSNSRDCFWGAVTHDCACTAAKLSIAAFPPLSFCCRGCWHPEKCKCNKNSSSGSRLPEVCVILYNVCPNTIILELYQGG